MTILTSCSYSHYDNETGVTHQFGFGYSRFKTLQTKDEIAVIRGIQNIGFAAGTGESSFLGLGYFDSATVSIFSKNFGLKVEDTKNDLFKSKFSSLNKKNLKDSK